MLSLSLLTSSNNQKFILKVHIITSFDGYTAVPSHISTRILVTTVKLRMENIKVIGLLLKYRLILILVNSATIDDELNFVSRNRNDDLINSVDYAVRV